MDPPLAGGAARRAVLAERLAPAGPGSDPRSRDDRRGLAGRLPHHDAPARLGDLDGMAAPRRPVDALAPRSRDPGTVLRVHGGARGMVPPASRGRRRCDEPDAPTHRLLPHGVRFPRPAARGGLRELARVGAMARGEGHGDDLPSRCRGAASSAGACRWADRRSVRAGRRHRERELVPPASRARTARRSASGRCPVRLVHLRAARRADGGARPAGRDVPRRASGARGDRLREAVGRLSGRGGATRHDRRAEPRASEGPRAPGTLRGRG